MKKIIYLSFIFLLASCGNKVTEKKEIPTDTTITNVDTSKSNNGIVKKEEPQIIDSSDIITNTEVLNESGQLDPNSTPIAVVQTIIKAAKSGNYTPLMKLSNPAIDMDGDAKDIINVANSSKGNQKEFKDYFGKAKIVGQPRIKKNIAEVDIETTAEGGDKETIICENKFDKWYLKGL
jgi:hypothetical protein